MNCDEKYNGINQKTLEQKIKISEDMLKTVPSLIRHLAIGSTTRKIVAKPIEFNPFDIPIVGEVSTPLKESETEPSKETETEAKYETVVGKISSMLKTGKEKLNELMQPLKQSISGFCERFKRQGSPLEVPGTASIPSPPSPPCFVCSCCRKTRLRCLTCYAQGNRLYTKHRQWR